MGRRYPHARICAIPALIPFRCQTEGERCFRSKHIDQNERSDLELPNRRDGLSAGKNAIRRLFALNRRVFVDAQHRLDRKGLADNSNVTSLEHDDQCERTTAVALRLPKGTVIEQSEVPLLHSVIHSSDLNVCSPAAGARTRNWAERLRNGSSTLRKCPICISGVSPTQPTPTR